LDHNLPLDFVIVLVYGIHNTNESQEIMILSYYYTGIHKDELPAFEKKAKKLQADYKSFVVGGIERTLQADYKSFVVGGIERTMRVHFTGDDLTECEKKASVFRKVYANKKEIGPWSREIR